jgi:hypothetical protein
LGEFRFDKILSSFTFFLSGTSQPGRCIIEAPFTKEIFKLTLSNNTPSSVNVDIDNWRFSIYFNDQVDDSVHRKSDDVRSIYLNDQVDSGICVKSDDVRNIDSDIRVGSNQDLFLSGTSQPGRCIMEATFATKIFKLTLCNNTPKSVTLDINNWRGSIDFNDKSDDVRSIDFDDRVDDSDDHKSDDVRNIDFDVRVGSNQEEEEEKAGPSKNPKK